ncbi:MAG: sulfatase [bacterium]
MFKLIDSSFSIRQLYFVTVTLCLSLLVGSLGCGKKRTDSVVSGDEVLIEHEEMLISCIPKDAGPERIEGGSLWRWGEVAISSPNVESATVLNNTAYGRDHWAIVAPAPTTLTFPAVQVGEEARVRFGRYLVPQAYKRGTDGATFRVWCATKQWAESDTAKTCVFEGRIVVRDDGEERRVQREDIRLPVEAGDNVRLIFETDPGPAGDGRADFCRWETPSVCWRRKVNRLPNEGPNAILFTLDTLRADRLHCYGYERRTSPAIDKLASQSIRMTRAYAQCSTTVPSHISIMTGRYLKEFGIYTQSDDALPDSFMTLAETLRNQGYATAGFLGVALLKDEWTGLGQGFDTFVECPTRGAVDGEYVINSVIDWLAENHGRRFFLWIHLYDCHVPYYPPEPFDNQFIDKKAAYLRDLARPLLPERGPEKWERMSKDYYRDRYDGGVSYTDSQVGRVVSTLKDLGLSDKTLVVVAADHGESLGEHSIYFAHISLYEPVVRVPLIFSWPGRIPEGRPISEVCGNVDIYPTVLDLLDIDTPNGLSGQSLLPIWSGQTAGRGTALSEHVVHAAISWRTEDWTYIYQPIASKTNRDSLPKMWRSGPLGAWTSRALREELYNWKDDPNESQDLSTSSPEKLKQLRADCLDWIEACDKAWETGDPLRWRDVDADRLMDLGNLGYVGGEN